jgi:hypothetical protein
MKGFIFGATFFSPLAKTKRAAERTMLKRTAIAIVRVSNNKKAIINFDMYSPVSAFKIGGTTLF